MLSTVHPPNPVGSTLMDSTTCGLKIFEEKVKNTNTKLKTIQIKTQSSIKTINIAFTLY